MVGNEQVAGAIESQADRGVQFRGRGRSTITAIPGRPSPGNRNDVSGGLDDLANSLIIHIRKEQVPIAVDHHVTW